MVRGLDVVFLGVGERCGVARLWLLITRFVTNEIKIPFKAIQYVTFGGTRVNARD